MVLGKLPVPGRPTSSDCSRARAHCASSMCGWGCLDIFILLCRFSPLSPSLWETARYRLKYCLKGPLNPKQPTNQPTVAEIQAVIILHLNFNLTWLLLDKTEQKCHKILGLRTNSVDPDQTAPQGAVWLNLHCLPVWKLRIQLLKNDWAIFFYQISE